MISGKTLAFDGNGNVIVGGSSSATATFGGTALANAGGKEAFFAKVTFFDPWFAAGDHESTAGGQCFIQFQRGLQRRCEQQCAAQLPMAIQWQPARRTHEVGLLTISNANFSTFGSYQVIVSNTIRRGHQRGGNS